MKLEYRKHNSGGRKVTIIRVCLTTREERRFLKETTARKRWPRNPYIAGDALELPGVDKREHATFIDIVGAE